MSAVSSSVHSFKSEIKRNNNKLEDFTVEIIQAGGLSSEIRLMLQFTTTFCQTKLISSVKILKSKDKDFLYGRETHT